MKMNYSYCYLATDRCKRQRPVA